MRRIKVQIEITVEGPDKHAKAAAKNIKARADQYVSSESQGYVWRTVKSDVEVKSWKIKKKWRGRR